MKQTFLIRSVEIGAMNLPNYLSKDWPERRSWGGFSVAKGFETYSEAETTIEALAGGYYQIDKVFKNEKLGFKVE